VFAIYGASAYVIAIWDLLRRRGRSGEQQPAQTPK
jgi:hypothetical protein